jgi:hypothetical protein
MIFFNYVFPIETFAKKGNFAARSPKPLARNPPTKLAQGLCEITNRVIEQV